MSEQNDSRYDEYTSLRFERPSDGVLLITLDAPEKLNATDGAMHLQLSRVFRTIDDDDSVRAVVVTGAGKAFSAGGDLSWITEQVGDYAQTMRVMKEAGDLVRTMIDCHTPIVSAINGIAVGAGLAVALLADISIIDEDTRLTDGHVRLGVAAGDHAAVIWPLLCGMAKAKYLLMLCEPVNGEDAEKYGLVSLCVEDDELQDKAVEVAAKLAAGAPSAIRWTKYALNNWYRMMGPTYDASTALEMLAFAGSEVKEGLKSHLEKRTPEFPKGSPV